MKTTMTNAELYPGFDLEAPAILASIEPGIQPVCDVLNSMDDVYTLWSCEGHADLPMLPYVVFIAPQPIAFKAYLLLSPSGGAASLKYNWSLYANFRNDGSLQYIIKLEDYRINNSSYRWWSSQHWKKSEMDVELVRLATLLTKLRD